MLLANKVPKKNLIQNFLSADWFADYSTGGGTMSVDPVNPHKMTLNMTVSAQGRLIWIPVEIGKTYTFSFKQLTGLYRIYKRKVGNHDANMVLVQDQNAGKPDTFSFTVDDTYKGFITIRLTFGSAGTFTFENLQLEVGSKTEFEPYTLVNPKASAPPVAVKNPKKNLIKPLNDSGWSKHANAVFVSDYYLKINQTSSFQTSGIDVTLQAGNSYTLSVDDISPNGRLYVRQTLGGAFTYYIVTATTKSLSFNAVAGASYRVEFHANTSINVEEYVKNFQLSLGNIAPFEPYQAVNPVATLYPKKNLIPPLTDPRWYVKSGFGMGEIVGDYEFHMVKSSAGVIGFDIPIKLKPNTIYTLGGTFIGGGARLRLMRNDNESFLINLNTGLITQTYTTGSFVDMRIRVENNSQAGDYTTKDFFMYEGSINNPVFEPYQLTNLRSV